jgi:hypothetical protein
LITVAIDYSPGAHGFFLEYVLNRWVFRSPYIMEDPFQSSGSSHKITQDTVYQESKVVSARHHSVYSNSYPQEIEKVIFIKHCQSLDYVLLTNVFYRTHADAIKVLDYPTEKIQQFHISNMLVEPTDLKLRANWYNKLLEQDIFGTNLRISTDLPCFEFDYRAFFNFSEFLNELQKVATFLNYTFIYDINLWHLWVKFIDTNQGWTAYQHANNVLKHIYSNQSMYIEPDWKLHAWLNTCLSRAFKIYSGELFDNVYTTDTKDVYRIIQTHLLEFDQQC